MVRIRVILLKNQALIADQCEVAEHFLDRLRGLIGKKGMSLGSGMLFPKNNSIHMWFMNIPIDVVFFSRTDFRVTSVHRKVRPWKLSPLWDLRATDTLELPVGTIDAHKIRIGDELCLNS